MCCNLFVYENLPMAKFMLNTKAVNTSTDAKPFVNVNVLAGRCSVTNKY